MTYASPGTAEYYRKNGKFADGTVLVKEVLGTDQAQLTTGNALWASGIRQWFFMIKDDKKRHRDNPLWGDGWDGHFLIPTRPTSKCRSLTRKTALGATSPPGRQTGSTSKVIQFSP
jgi:hypothetical protein